MVSTLSSPLPHPALPNADWGDAYEVTTSGGFASARQAAQAVVDAFPLWTYPLLVLRNVIVWPFGLKNTRHAATMLPEPVGFFPVQAETTHQVVAGFDDKHLDFRLIVDLDSTDAQQQIRVTTVVHRNNRLGRWYLAMVLPFHRAIIKSALGRL
ncbi:MAG: DUF2867 domain-containing protein [Pseudomonadota bacterium]